jgi:hypothetical protein
MILMPNVEQGMSNVQCRRECRSWLENFSVGYFPPERTGRLVGVRYSCLPLGSASSCRLKHTRPDILENMGYIVLRAHGSYVLTYFRMPSTYSS